MSTTRSYRSPRRLVSVVFVLSMLALPSCFSFNRAGLLEVRTGYRAATVTIFRHASRDLGYACYAKTRFDEQGPCAAAVLRSAADQASVKGFARARWLAATAPDQYSDIRDSVQYLTLFSQCLAVRMKIGMMNIGYSWFLYDLRKGGCVWGADPNPDVP